MPDNLPVPRKPPGWLEEYGGEVAEYLPVLKWGRRAYVAVDKWFSKKHLAEIEKLKAESGKLIGTMDEQSKVTAILTKEIDRCHKKIEELESTVEKQRQEISELKKPKA